MTIGKHYITTIATLLIAIGCFVTPAYSKTVAKQTQVLTLGGRLVCNSDQQYTVPTKLGKVTCSPHSTVFVFANEQSVSIFNFDSVKKEDVTVFVGKKQVLLRPAEQFVVGQVANAKFDDINPGLGIVHKKPQSIDLGSGLTGYIAEFSLVSGIHKIPLLNKMTSSTKPGEKQIIERILKNAAILQSSAERMLRRRPAQPSGSVAQLLDRSKSLAEAQILQGSVEKFGQEAAQHVDMRIAECRKGGCARASGLSWLELAEGEWKLRTAHPDNQYEVAGIFSCPIDTCIKTDLGNIECKRGSIVFVVNCEKSVSVCTLDSPSLGAVHVQVGNSEKLRLAPGRQIVMTKDADSAFDKTNPAHLIGYRDEKEIGTVDGVKVIRSDFSITSAMMAIKPLRGLVASQDRDHNRIAENIMKNSAILWGLTSRDGIFHPAK